MSIARRRCMPVVVSSQPPMTWGMRLVYLVCMRCTRSPPSSIIMFGAASSTRQRFSLYCSIVQPYSANTCMPPAVSAAATSSCVDSGFEPVTYISAPPISSTRQRYAVLASRCTDSAIFIPANGRVRVNSSPMPRSTGMLRSTHFIFISPEGAMAISLMQLICLYPLISYLLI